MFIKHATTARRTAQLDYKSIYIALAAFRNLVPSETICFSDTAAKILAHQLCWHLENISEGLEITEIMLITSYRLEIGAKFWLYNFSLTVKDFNCCT